jgi:SAM-dependent methyltransferase
MHPAEYARMFEIEDDYWWFVSRRELVVDVAKHLRINGSPLIIDIGCGTGATACALEALGRVVAVDFSLLALQACRRRGLAHLLRSRAESIPLANESADVIVATDVLEHLDDDHGALREFRRVLKPGGHAVITVPAYEFLWSEHDLALMHKRRYTSRHLKELSGRAGFRQVHTGYSLFLLFPFALGRLLKRAPVAGQVPRAMVKSVPHWLNSTLIRLQRFEMVLSRRITLPWGLSIVSVIQKRLE